MLIWQFHSTNSRWWIISIICLNKLNNYYSKSIVVLLFLLHRFLPKQLEYSLSISTAHQSALLIFFCKIISTIILKYKYKYTTLKASFNDFDFRSWESYRSARSFTHHGHQGGEEEEKGKARRNIENLSLKLCSRCSSHSDDLKILNLVLSKLCLMTHTFVFNLLVVLDTIPWFVKSNYIISPKALFFLKVYGIFPWIRYWIRFPGS